MDSNSRLFGLLHASGLPSQKAQTHTDATSCTYLVERKFDVAPEQTKQMAREKFRPHQFSLGTNPYRADD
ncbi:MAG: hypothetical protein HQL38_13055 [Alphaproteobacteria bacterium]|nr:hypothetical protein [Alphaproteobacteria bacterium]